MPAQQQQQASPQQMNIMARNMIMQRGVQMTQQILSQTFVPANQNVVNVIPRNAGLIKGFWVKVVATITNNAAGGAITPTDFGASNILSQISFTDLQNNVRIQTIGAHLHWVNSIKAKKPYGASLISGFPAGAATGEDSPCGWGSNWTQQISMPASINNGGATGTVIMWYWVPLAYSDSDYRGAVFANVVSSQMQLQLTINPVPVVNSATTDTTNAVYSIGSAPGATTVNSSTTITVYQVYMDQIPMGKNGPILPMLDLATVYELKSTNFTAITAAQDFPVQYPNFRDFLSTMAIYNNNGTTRGVGADINYWELLAANFTPIWKIEPGLAALKTRNMIWADCPKGVYYFGSREKPISTVQYGNMQLVLNAITAGAGAYMNVFWEDFAMMNALTQAGSLPAN